MSSTAPMAARPIPRSGGSTPAAAAGATTSSRATPCVPKMSSSATATSSSPSVKEDYTGADGIARPYTSGRIETKGLFAQAYGRIEARMKLPVGKGIWPAFWLLGDADPKVKWPAMGEIDIMEAIGDPHTIYSTLHGPGYSGSDGISKKFPLPDGARHRQRLPRLRGGVGAQRPEVLLRRPPDRRAHPGRPAPRSDLGLRAPVLHHPQRRGRRRLAGQSRTRRRPSRSRCWWTMCGCTGLPTSRPAYSRLSPTTSASAATTARPPKGHTAPARGYRSAAGTPQAAPCDGRDG